MHFSRRSFLKLGSRAGLLATTSSLWSGSANALQYTLGGDYKALVVLALLGGNDGNNTIISTDPAQFRSYASLRGNLALDRSALIPLQHSTGSAAYGLHPSLKNVASFYNSGSASIVANVGPISRPATKQQILASPADFPGGSLSHTVAQNAWETADDGNVGWGGRVADNLTSQSGSLPPLLTTAQSVFTVGRTVQAVAVQGGAAFEPLPPGLTTVLANMARQESTSSRALVAATANLRSRALASQETLSQAATYDHLKTTFGSTQLQQGLKTVAQLISGRSVVGASRQIFYTQQGGYDHHSGQLDSQAALLSDLDQGLASFMAALDEMGMRDKVMICTHSDFSRTLTPNTSGGTDHAWGNHHFVLGGGISGGRVIGSMPDMEVGGLQDTTGQGVWIPTQSVVQMTGGLSSWLGLSPTQINSLFPDLANFSAGSIRLN